MTNSKKKLFTVLALVVVMCLTIFTLSACGNTDSVVKFMVQENEEWKVQTSVTAVDGVVKAPEAPAKEYYTFAGWYLDKEFKKEFDTSNKVDTSHSVYAKYTPVEAAIIMDGEFKGDKNLVDVKANNVGIVAKEGLTFDGWYKDAACQVKWQGEANVQALYARSMAKVTFTNGWAEDDFVTLVKPGEKVDLQKEVTLEDETTTTYELANIVKPYMSKYDLDYVNDEGVAIDFNKPFDKNTTITVLWNTKDLGACLKVLPKSTEGHYYIEPNGQSGFAEEVQSAPILSFRNKVTREKTETVDGEQVTTVEELVVDSLSFYTDNAIPDSVKKIIFGEGIQVIQNVNGVAASSVEEIVLPSTLKILDNSFNNMPNLKGVTLPEKLEVLIGSFFLNTYKGTAVDHSLGMANENYEIAVPDSVKNIAMMPTNLTFSKTKDTAKDGDFYKGEDGNIYLKDARGLILVADANAVTGTREIVQLGQVLPTAGTIVVPEGVVGIQAGTYASYYDYLVMPKSFKFINYNANVSDYAAIYDLYNTEYTRGGNVLFEENQFNQHFSNIQENMENGTNIDNKGLFITDTVGGLNLYGMIKVGGGILVMPTTKDARPANIDLALVNVVGSAIHPLPYVTDFVNFADDKNTVYVTCAFVNSATNFPCANTIKLEGLKNVSIAAVKEALIASNEAIQGSFDNQKSFDLYDNGVKLADNAAVTGDMYLTAVLVEKAKLYISSNWQVGYTGGGFSADDYKNPEAATNFKTGDFMIIKTDITGMTLDTLKAEIKAQALAEAMEDFYVGNFATEENAKAYLEYFYTNATLELKVNGEVVSDLSGVNLDNDDVKLEVNFTLAAQA